MFDLLEGKETRCEFSGVETVLNESGRYCCVPVTHKVTLGQIVDLLEEFKFSTSIIYSKFFIIGNTITECTHSTIISRSRMTH